MLLLLIFKTECFRNSWENIEFFSHKSLRVACCSHAAIHPLLTRHYSLLRTSLSKVAVLPSTSPTNPALPRRDHRPRRQCYNQRYETPPPLHSIQAAWIYTMTQKATQYHIKSPHITSDPRTGPIQATLFMSLWFFFFFLQALSLIPLQLLDNANRSQANGTEQDNGAFIAAWLTWL